MGVAMQEVVQRKAAAEEIEIAVRIGVHTGRVTGGIIGTVRFHLDMWGCISARSRLDLGCTSAVGSTSTCGGRGSTGRFGWRRLARRGAFTSRRARASCSRPSLTFSCRLLTRAAVSRYELLKTYVNCTPNLRREDIPPADVEVGIQGTYWVSPGGADDRGSCDLNDVSASAGARALRALPEGGGGDQRQRVGMRSLLAKPLAASARASASIQGQASGGRAR